MTASTTHVVFHYPPELLQLLKDTIPLLCRSKKDVLSFFEGAGVPESLYSDLQRKVETDRQSISKFEIARVVLERLNQKKDSHLRELREVVRRVTEFEDFSTCWESDQLKAKGLVAEIRRVVDVKDAFTKMRIEKEREAEKAKTAAEGKAAAARKHREEIEGIKKDLFALFIEANAQKRGKSLEAVLNRLFEIYGMAVREAFTVKGTCSEGVIEQIDGVVEFDGDLYLVEMKWWKTPIGTGEVSPHIVRVFNRGLQVKGIFISYTDYTDGAIETCKAALAGGAVIALCTLQEIVSVLENYEQGADLRTMLRAKVHAALLDRKPWHKYTL